MVLVCIFSNLSFVERLLKKPNSDSVFIFEARHIKQINNINEVLPHYKILKSENTFKYLPKNIDF